MSSPVTDLNLLVADGLLVLHSLIVVFVVGGLFLIILGGLRGWAWVHNRWFRLAHLGAIGCVVVQSWLGLVCPLTTWEMAMRTRAGEAVYSGSFVAHWLSRLLYYDAPAWVFVLSYTLFAALVVACWFWVRPGEKVSGSGRYRRG